MLREIAPFERFFFAVFAPTGRFLLAVDFFLSFFQYFFRNSACI